MWCLRTRKKVVKTLKDALKNADELVLATDEDREGESISWHLLQVLKPKVPIKRMVFHEITEEAIQAALDNCRDIDDQLVRAQETRRILDRLVGYTLSPLLWKKDCLGTLSGPGTVRRGQIAGRTRAGTAGIPARLLLGSESSIAERQRIL
jgi:DNA topoisomerase-1